MPTLDSILTDIGLAVESHAMAGDSLEDTYDMVLEAMAITYEHLPREDYERIMDMMEAATYLHLCARGYTREATHRWIYPDDTEAQMLDQP